MIGKALQSQYERWSIWKETVFLYDATIKAINERIKRVGDVRLFHYNGHGMPLITQQGELWFFNHNYTEYIPVHVSVIDALIGRPAVYVFDCSMAGRLLPFLTGNDVFVFAACGADQHLPDDPRLPADLLTACLTSPIESELKFHNFEVPSGKLGDRRTPLGKLNWIFQSLTQAILFEKGASFDAFPWLLRNWLLALRIGRFSGINPVSYPFDLNACLKHNCWFVWELVLQGIDSTGRHPFFYDYLCSFSSFIQSEQSQLESNGSFELVIALQSLLDPDHQRAALNCLCAFTGLNDQNVKLAIDAGIVDYLSPLLNSSGFKSQLVGILFQVLRIDNSFKSDIIVNFLQNCLQILETDCWIEVKETASACLCLLEERIPFDKGNPFLIINSKCNKETLLELIRDDSVEVRACSAYLLKKDNSSSEFLTEHLNVELCYLVRREIIGCESKIKDHMIKKLMFKQRKAFQNWIHNPPKPKKVKKDKFLERHNLKYAIEQLKTSKQFAMLSSIPKLQKRLESIKTSEDENEEKIEMDKKDEFPNILPTFHDEMLLIDVETVLKWSSGWISIKRNELQEILFQFDAKKVLYSSNKLWLVNEDKVTVFSCSSQKIIRELRDVDKICVFKEKHCILKNNLLKFDEKMISLQLNKLDCTLNYLVASNDDELIFMDENLRVKTKKHLSFIDFLCCRTDDLIAIKLERKIIVYRVPEFKPCFLITDVRGQLGCFSWVQKDAILITREGEQQFHYEIKKAQQK